MPDSHASQPRLAGPARLVIASGQSGAGKTIALHALEDCGFYCVDNLPVALLPSLLEHLIPGTEAQDPAPSTLQSGRPTGIGPESTTEMSADMGLLAIGVDIRGGAQTAEIMGEVLTDLRRLLPEREITIVFLQADEATLLRRYAETRRPHPLTREGLSLPEAITREREALAPLLEMADVRIDTSRLSVPQLRSQVTRLLGAASPGGMLVQLLSFGYKQGLPAEADLVFDARCLPNPHWDPQLRPLSGLDAPVAEFLGEQPEVNRWYADLELLLLRWLPTYAATPRSYLTVAIGCTGGRHRSVYLSERLTQSIRSQGLPWPISLHHRDLT